MELIKYNKDHTVRPFGLHNTGVICYFNSMLQCFVSCTSVVETFTKNPDLQQRNALCAAVWKFIQAARPKSLEDQMDSMSVNNRNDEIASLSPVVWRELIKRLKQTGKLTGSFGMGQEDSHEGFIWFLDALDAPEIEQLFEHRYRHIITCKKCGHRHKIPGDESVYIEFSLEEVKKYEGDLQQMILRQTPEIDNNYKCAKCGEKGEKEKSSTLSMTPEVLIVLLKKYHGKWAIDAPTDIAIPSASGEPFRYKLIALSEHSGGMAGGHYWANAVRDDEKIWNLNDTSVTPGILKSGMSTYMMWYHVV